MHRVVETDPRRCKKRPAYDSCRFELSRGGENDRSRKSMIGQEGGVARAVARFITNLFTPGIDARAHQRMEPFGNLSSLFGRGRIVFDPVALSLEGIGRQRNS